jgi:hypothetical protein
MRSFSLLSFSAFALVAPLSVHGVQHPVIVGGTGGLVYDPEFVVSTPLRYIQDVRLNTIRTPKLATPFYSLSKEAIIQ